MLWRLNILNYTSIKLSNLTEIEISWDLRFRAKLNLLAKTHRHIGYQEISNPLLYFFTL